MYAYSTFAAFLTRTAVSKIGKEYKEYWVGSQEAESPGPTLLITFVRKININCLVDVGPGHENTMVKRQDPCPQEQMITTMVGNATRGKKTVWHTEKK